MIMAEIEDRVAVITGASSGLGKAIASEIARKGIKVALMARRTELLKENAAEIVSAGGQALALPVDVSDANAVRAAFEELDNHFHRVDYLFNAAGILTPIKPLVNVDEAEFQSGIMVNMMGLVHTTKQALARMLEGGDGGTVINITSGAAYHAYSGWSLYSSSKAAMDMLTRCVAIETQGTKTRIAAIAPGIFESRMQQTIRSTAKSDFPEKDKFVKMHE
jgi:3-oxoacyl-[acyl-carrier protein] reductase